jgi:hypothetical protein
MNKYSFEKIVNVSDNRIIEFDVNLPKSIPTGFVSISISFSGVTAADNETNEGMDSHSSTKPPKLR